MPPTPLWEAATVAQIRHTTALQCFGKLSGSFGASSVKRHSRVSHAQSWTSVQPERWEWRSPPCRRVPVASLPKSGRDRSLGPTGVGLKSNLVGGGRLLEEYRECLAAAGTPVTLASSVAQNAPGVVVTPARCRCRARVDFCAKLPQLDASDATPIVGSLRLARMCFGEKRQRVYAVVAIPLACLSKTSSLGNSL